MTRTVDKELVCRTMGPYLPIHGFEPEEWLANDLNVALTNDEEDIGLFERQLDNPQTVHGHYFFNSRGGKALKAAKQMISEIFTGSYNVGAIVGLTPLDHKGALWMNRRLGFQSLGITDTVEGKHEMVFLSKPRWENLNNE